MKQQTFDAAKCPNSSAVFAMLCEKYPKDVVKMHDVSWADCTVTFDLAAKEVEGKTKAA